MNNGLTTYILQYTNDPSDYSGSTYRNYQDRDGFNVEFTTSSGAYQVSRDLKRLQFAKYWRVVDSHGRVLDVA